MAALDTMVVATALSTIQADLHASVEQLEWTLNAYNLSFAVLMITGAALGDRFGRRRLFAVGIGVFTVASAACALAPSIELLIAARAIQGAGAALVAPLALALLSAAFPQDRRGAAIGIFSAITGIAVALGPLVGGAVVEGLAWQWIFWVNVPIGLAVVPLALTKMRESYGPDNAIDIFGLTLIATSVFGFVWGLVRGNQAGWDSPEVLTALIGGVLLAGAFVIWQLRAPEPMLPVAMFRDRSFTAGNAAIFFTFASLFMMVFFYAQFLQVVMGFGPLGTGLRLLPWTATFITIAPLAGALADRIGERPFLVAGLSFQAASLVWFASTVSADMTYSSILGPFILGGVGVSMAIPCAQNSAVASFPIERLGKAAGVNSTFRELGGVFGLAIGVAVFASSGSVGSPLEFVDGFKPAVIAAASLAAAGAIVGSFVPGRRSEVTRTLALEGSQ
jgi:EmrB/QacA subfamily drug resistance transporter